MPSGQRIRYPHGRPLDATVALGGPEAVGHPKDQVYNEEDRLTTFTRELNTLCQRVVAGKGQPAET